MLQTAKGLRRTDVVKLDATVPPQSNRIGVTLYLQAATHLPASPPAQ